VTLSLRSAVGKSLLVLMCLGTLSIYIGRVVRVYLAERYADSLTVADAERAMRLVPGDADFPYLLGVLISASGQDKDGAIANLREAVTLNPNIGKYWLDLASVYHVTGNVEKQNEALDSAVHAEPDNPEIAAEAAQYFLAAGDTARALPLFQQALLHNPEAAGAILPVCWRATRDANLLLAQVIPGNPELQLAFLRLLTEQEETETADQVWQNLVTSRSSFSPQLSFFYFDYLLKEHEVTGFDRAWRELAGLSHNLQAYLPNDNLIVNAGFEQPLLYSGFDWRYQPADHIAAGIDDHVAHSGTHSLALSYDGNSAYDAGWKEFVPVRSNTEYNFSAWVKSEDVTSSSGPRIGIMDAYSGANLLLTDDVLDTHPWQEIKGTFRVPADTELLVVKVIRAPTEPRIRGRIWVDDLRLSER